MASGFKINLQKRKLIGVGVTPSQIVSTDGCMGCASDSLLFIHLGVPVGQNMSRVNA